MNVRAAFDRRLGIASFLASFGLLLVVFGASIPRWFPSTDDWTVIPHAALLTPGARWTDWFASGFRDYYDNLTLPYYRPLLDFFYWAVWKLLGPDWPLWEIVTLALHATGVATATIVARRAYGLGLAPSAAAGALMLACPAALNEESLTVFSLNNELLIAPLAGAAFFLVRSQRFLAAAFCLMAAMLLKETSFWLVPAAVLSSFRGQIGERSLVPRARALVLLTLPVAAYLFLRLVVYTPVGGGGKRFPGYFSNSEGLTYIALKHLLIWPSGYVNPSIVRHFRSHGDMVVALIFVSIAVNLYCWILLAGLAWRALSQALTPDHWLRRALQPISQLAVGGGRPDPSDARPDAWLPAVWALTGAAFLVLAPTDHTRYGYSEAVFLIPGFLAAAAWRVSAALLGATTLGWAVVLQATGAAPWLLGPRIGAAADFAAAMESAPTQTRNVDEIGWSRNLAPFMALLGRRFAVTRLAVVLDNCDAPAFWRVTHHRRGDVVDVTLALPGCQFVTPRPMTQPLTGRAVNRADGVDYDLVTAISSKRVDDGPRSPGWLVNHGLEPPSRWPAAWRPGANSFEAHVAVSQPTRFIIQNPDTGQTDVWDEAGPATQVPAAAAGAAQPGARSSHQG